MPKPNIADIAIAYKQHGAGYVIHEPEGDYTIDPGGISATLAPKASGASKAGPRGFTVNGTRYQEVLDKNGDPILDENGETKVEQVGPQASTTVAPSSSVYTPPANGKPGSFTQAPAAPARNDSPAETATSTAAGVSAGASAETAATNAATAPANAAANVTNSQTGLINAKISELANNAKLTEDQRKAEFDTWWKINIELPQAQETAAMARQKYANDEGDKAVQRSVYAENARTIANPAWHAAVNAPAFINGQQAAPGYGADYGDLNGVYQARAMAALKDISPVAAAAWNAQFNNGQGLGVPQVAAPAVLPGGGPNEATAATPISNELGGDPVALAQKIAAQAAANKAAAVPFTVDNNASRNRIGAVM